MGQGGVVTDGMKGPASAAPWSRTVAPLETMSDTPLIARAGSPRLRVLLAITLIATILALLPGRKAIPPLIESDYCYLLTAADRLFDGHGLTTPPPVASNQPWEWTADWAFLTRWPMGYPLLVCATRLVFGLATLEACRWISLFACATALVGWFLWVKRCVPRGVTGLLLAAVAAGCAVSTASLLNPSTDLILVALLPFVLMAAMRAVAVVGTGDEPSDRRRAMWTFAFVGLLCGGMFWIRYAAVFVPVGVGAFLVAQRLRGSRVSVQHLASFAAAAVVPMAALVLINRAMSAGSSVQAQLNLGHSAAINLTVDQFVTTWRNFTRFGFYDYHAASPWLFSLWPVALVAGGLCIRPVRRALRSFFASPGVLLSMCTLGALMAMLVSVTALFGDKFDYVSLERYYTAAKPLYFVLFVAPLMLIPGRVVRVGLCLVMLVASSWLIQQEWSRPYKRWQAANRPSTPYGQWANCFGPGAAELYAWLGEQKGDDLIVVSNFHEYITLETKIPALPIPKDAATLQVWVDRISASRGVANPRVLFVLDPDNRWRDYWIDPPPKIISDFMLRIRADAPPGIGADVFLYSPAVVSR